MKASFSLKNKNMKPSKKNDVFIKKKCNVDVRKIGLKMRWSIDVDDEQSTHMGTTMPETRLR